MTAWTLVTGGAGYIGSMLVPELLERGRKVRVLDSLAHGNATSLLRMWSDERFEFIRGDVSDESVVDASLSDVAEIVHLAAIVGDPACSREPDLARQVNVEGTRHLLDGARDHGVERFLFSSTCSNYGKMNNSAELATEEWELRPVSLYAETKVEAELDTLSHAAPDFCAACLRLATVYGVSPRMRFDLTVNEFARDVAINRSVVVYGEQFWRPYVHVRDAARAFAIALDAPREVLSGQVFNVGSTSENYRKIDLVELLRERIPDADVQFVRRDEDPRDYRVSFDKIASQLGFTTRRSVPDGIDEIFRLLASEAILDPYAPEYRN